MEEVKMPVKSLVHIHMYFCFIVRTFYTVILHNNHDIEFIG